MIFTMRIPSVFIEENIHCFHILSYLLLKRVMAFLISCCMSAIHHIRVMAFLISCCLSAILVKASSVKVSSTVFVILKL